MGPNSAGGSLDKTSDVSFNQESKDKMGPCGHRGVAGGFQTEGTACERLGKVSLHHGGWKQRPACEGRVPRGGGGLAPRSLQGLVGMARSGRKALKSFKRTVTCSG